MKKRASVKPAIINDQDLDDESEEVDEQDPDEGSVIDNPALVSEFIHS